MFVGTDADAEKLIYLPAYWYVLNIISVLLSVGAVQYGCYLCDLAFQDQDDDSEWSYRYLIFVIMAITELPLMFFLQYFYVERLLLPGEVSIFVTLNIIVSLITILLFCESIYTILKPMLKLEQLKETVFTDFVIIIFSFLMFICLIVGFSLRLIISFVVYHKTSHYDIVPDNDYTKTLLAEEINYPSDNQTQILPCTTFTLDFNSPNFHTFDKITFTLILGNFVFGFGAVGVYLYSIFFSNSLDSGSIYESDVTSLRSTRSRQNMVISRQGKNFFMNAIEKIKPSGLTVVTGRKSRNSLSPANKTPTNLNGSHQKSTLRNAFKRSMTKKTLKIPKNFQIERKNPGANFSGNAKSKAKNSTEVTSTIKNFNLQNKNNYSRFEDVKSERSDSAYTFESYTETGTYMTYTDVE